MKNNTQQVDREIARRNRVFTKATKAQKRVLIAKDVLQLLTRKTIKAERGVYVRPKRLGDGPLPPGSDVQKDLLSGDVTCDCCGIGALFLSAICFRDNVKTDDLGRHVPTGLLADDGGYIKWLFGMDQLRGIEHAFESSVPAESPASLAAKAPTDDARLRAIMRNIIKHKGRFEPRSYWRQTEPRTKAEVNFAIVVSIDPAAPTLDRRLCSSTLPFSSQPSA